MQLCHIQIDFPLVFHLLFLARNHEGKQCHTYSQRARINSRGSVSRIMKRARVIDTESRNNDSQHRWRHGSHRIKRRPFIISLTLFDISVDFSFNAAVVNFWCSKIASAIFPPTFQEKIMAPSISPLSIMNWLQFKVRRVRSTNESISSHHEKTFCCTHNTHLF